MSSDTRLTLILTFISVLGLPTLVFALRMMSKWTRVEDKLENLFHDVHELVEAKDKVHSTIFATMRDDRAATDKRLRWLEENVWKKGNTPNG